MGPLRLQGRTAPGEQELPIAVTLFRLKRRLYSQSSRKSSHLFLAAVLCAGAHSMTPIDLLPRPDSKIAIVPEFRRRSQSICHLLRPGRRRVGKS